MRQLESLDAFRVARGISSATYRLTSAAVLRSHPSLVDQIRRAAISIPANIAEGYALGTRPQWIRHLRIALGSTAELRSHIQVALDLGLVPPACGTDSLEEIDRLISLLVGLLKGAGARLPGR
jgi:four helix bundle protein